MKFRLSLDTAAIGVLIFLTAAVGLAILLGIQAGVRVTVILPERGLIGPFQKIKLVFSESVDPDLTKPHFSIQPALNGRLEWLDNHTLQFVPIAPFQPDTVYKLTLRAGVLSANGSALKSNKNWEIQVRAPLIVYLNVADKQSSLWTMDLKGSPVQQLTPETTRVISFDVSRDGEFIIFTSMNQKGGIDLWHVNRAGNNASILLDCGLDQCTTPAISPDGTRIAYSREAAGVSPGFPFGSPRTWLLDLQSGQDNAVYADRQIIGYGPSWSPDSKKLSSYDGLADQVRVLDLTDNQQYIFQSNTGGPITWSPDSIKMLFTNIAQGESGLRTSVHIADLSLDNSSILIGAKDDRDYSYNSLAWSPVEDSVVLGLRISDDQPGEAFWLFDPGVLDGILIADQKDYTYDSPRWDPWGTALVFQQFNLHGQFKSEIDLWEPGFSEPLILTPGLMPHWLP